MGRGGVARIAEGRTAAGGEAGLQRRGARFAARRVVALRELIGVDEGARFGAEDGAFGEPRGAAGGGGVAIAIFEQQSRENCGVRVSAA